jgi:hypothetical protein
MSARSARKPLPRVPVAARRTSRPRIRRRALVVWMGVIALLAAVATLAMLRIYPPR